MVRYEGGNGIATGRITIGVEMSIEVNDGQARQFISSNHGKSDRVVYSKCHRQGISAADGSHCFRNPSERNARFHWFHIDISDIYPLGSSQDPLFPVYIKEPICPGIYERAFAYIAGTIARSGAGCS